MLIIDNNLKNLAENNHICSKKELIEDFCIQIRLSSGSYYKPKHSTEKIVYGLDSHKITELYEEIHPHENPLILNPGEQVLACSQETYSIPDNIFGLVQTKGTLARMFVQVTCCDGQIEPGFIGKITLEIVNLSPFPIEIPQLSNIGQLYLFNCSMNSSKEYLGKYSNSDKPTIPNFDGF